MRLRFWLGSLAVLLPMAVGGGTPPASAQASPGAQAPPVFRDYLGEDLVVLIHSDRGPQVCIGEGIFLEGRVEKYGIYQDLNVRRPTPYLVRNTTWAVAPTITLTNSNPSAFEVDVARNDGGSASSYFNLGKAAAVGVTNLHFTAASPGARSGEWDVQLDVRECDYHVFTLSRWLITGTGWNTKAWSSIDTVIPFQGTRPGTTVTVHAAAVNYAISRPPFGCQEVHTVSTADAEVSSSLDLTRGAINVRVQYGNPLAGTGASCPDAGTGATADQARIDPISFTESAAGGELSKPHVLHAIGVGDYTGSTDIQITKIVR